MKLKNVVTGSLLIGTLLMTGCNKNETSKVTTPPAGNTLLTFVEYEKDVDPYQTRVVVTPEFMRFDDGEGSLDFILFDRKKDIIYSVNSDDRTVLAVERQDVNIKPPFELKLTQQKLGNMEGAPQIDGKQPQHYQFSANGEVCFDAVVVPGLMPDVVAAMQAFDDLLASDSKVTFNRIPADMQNACDISMGTFAPGRHLAYGFPIQEWSESGSGRTLVDYQLNYKPEAALFVLPTEYQHFTIQEFREGKVKIQE
jgi:hypothetical protein